MISSFQQTDLKPIIAKSPTQLGILSSHQTWTSNLTLLLHPPKKNGVYTSYSSATSCAEGGPRLLVLTSNDLVEIP